MTRSNRTNPAYAFLAYRRAVIQHISTLLDADYTAPLNQEANKQIFSDEVMRGDDEVPMEEIRRYIEELNQQDAELLIEMKKFEFRKIEEPKSTATEVPSLKDQPNDSAGPQESKDPPSNGGPTAPPAIPANK